MAWCVCVISSKGKINPFNFLFIELSPQEAVAIYT